MILSFIIFRICGRNIKIGPKMAAITVTANLLHIEEEEESVTRNYTYHYYDNYYDHYYGNYHDNYSPDPIEILYRKKHRQTSIRPTLKTINQTKSVCEIM